MNTLRAFHSDPAIKKKYVARVAAHKKADELVRGATGHNERGCAVWCTLDAYEHSRYPVDLGIPLELAHLEDRLFEGMPIAKSMLWPGEFLRAIKPGADLSGVWPKFAIWLLKDVRKHARPDGRRAIDDVVALYREGVPRDDGRWRKARSAACAAAGAAYAAAYVADVADAAYAAAARAAAAAAAADADADAARSAARAQHFYRQSRKLLDLLKHAPVRRRVK